MLDLLSTRADISFRKKFYFKTNLGGIIIIGALLTLGALVYVFNMDRINLLNPNILTYPSNATFSGNFENITLVVFFFFMKDYYIKDSSYNKTKCLEEYTKDLNPKEKDYYLLNKLLQEQSQYDIFCKFENISEVYSIQRNIKYYLQQQQNQ